MCGKELPPERSVQGAFCSERCRLNDLSKWFGENYRIATSPDQGASEDSEVDEGES